MTPTDFVAKWQHVRLSERSACQQHFCDLCEMLGHPKPAETLGRTLVRFPMLTAHCDRRLRFGDKMGRV